MSSDSRANPLIALVSATAAAIAPATRALSAEFPEASVWNILDDRLQTDATARGGVTPQLAQRVTRLIDHALAEGADGVLLTCSMYGPAADAFVASHVHVLAADDAAFDEAVGGGFQRILVVASFDAALRDTEARFAAAVARAGADLAVSGTVAAAAFDAAQAADDIVLLAALEDACRPFAGQVDAVLLAQYSLAPAAAALSEALGIPVISGPASAAKLLRSRIARMER
jgi:phosphohistidine swiveling domain-containing protein